MTSAGFASGVFVGSGVFFGPGVSLATGLRVGSGRSGVGVGLGVRDGVGVDVAERVGVGVAVAAGVLEAAATGDSPASDPGSLSTTALFEPQADNSTTADRTAAPTPQRFVITSIGRTGTRPAARTFGPNRIVRSDQFA